MKMNEQKRKCDALSLAFIFFGMPIFLYIMGDFPRRTILKEYLSLLTLLTFSLMLMQFFLMHPSHSILSGHRRSTAIWIHKIIGSVFATVLLVHPLLIVFPRYYEAGVTPTEALVTIVTTFTSLGVVIGITAWFLLLILAITALLRKRLPVAYKTWRLLHAILSIFFVGAGAWHVVNLGRHSDIFMGAYITTLTTCSILIQLKTYMPEGFLAYISSMKFFAHMKPKTYSRSNYNR